MVLRCAESKMYCSETDNWFKAKTIHFSEDYSIETNRESLYTIFTFSDLKTYGCV